VRPAAPEEASRPARSGELTGVALLILAVVLLLALVSFNQNDLPSRALPVNDPPHNLLGRIGAFIADQLLFAFGAASFLLPVLAAAFGAASFIPELGYLRRGWRASLASVGLFIAAMGTLDLSSHVLPSLATHGNTLGAGGLVGSELNARIAVFFLNRVGAAIVYGSLYLVSLVTLTRFDLPGWLRSIVSPPPRNEEERMLAEQKLLKKKARELARQSQEVMAKAAVPPTKGSANRSPVPTNGREKEPGTDPAGLGPDLKPVPEPRFQDNSVPSSRTPVDQPIDAMRISASEIVSFPLPPGSKSPTGSPASTAGQHLDTDSTGDDGGSGEDFPEQSVPTPRGRMVPRRNKPISVATTPMINNYQLPSLDLLNQPDLTVKPTESKEEYLANSRLMVQTLAQFGIEVASGDITRGPTITRYELHPAPGVKLEKIAALTNNITAALKAERINVLAPIPGKSSVGIEVPNTVKTKVIMRDLFESPEWSSTRMRIPLALGKDVYGHPIFADLGDMPHLLIAGSTGSGKSVCINTIIASLLYRFGPDQLRFVMIDPKVVELQQYNSLPHLVVPVVTDPKKVVLALRWVVNEMEKRYQIFAKVGVRNIKSFNERPKDKPLVSRDPELPLTARKEKVEPGADGFAVEVDEQIVVPRDDDIVIPEKLSYIVVIIDELADLMLVAPADVEMAIARITQMARAAGIHCIVATQRPSVDVITGVIKANIPARIAFQVAQKVDSRTILDQMGADKLLGKGDMLYLPPGSGKLTRAQGALITDQEIERVVEFIARQGKPSYEVEIHRALQKSQGSANSFSLEPESAGDDADEEIINKCIDVIRSEKKASVSLLQRRLKLGYGRASRMMDVLEERGIVGPSKGAEPRDILLDLDGEGYDGSGQQMV
jgi:DNA segregation ATPase FtsK/SpoIIIE, S-DNA-T family